MRLTLIRWLKALTAWLEGPPGESTDVIVEYARTLVRHQVVYRDRSGEAKRHQVYAYLIKAFPEESKRRLSRAIEDALDLEVPA